MVEQTNYVPLILLAVAALLFVGFILPSLSTAGQEHYTATIPISVVYSLDPIDVYNGNVGIYTGTSYATDTGTFCLPDLTLPQIPNLFPTGGPVLPAIQGTVSVKATGTVTKTVDLGSFSVDAVTRFDKSAEFHCLVAGSYSGRVIVYKKSGAVQTKDFSFHVP
jgi:hypothetical protein